MPLSRCMRGRYRPPPNRIQRVDAPPQPSAPDLSGGNHTDRGKACHQRSFHIARQTCILPMTTCGRCFSVADSASRCCMKYRPAASASLTTNSARMGPVLICARTPSVPKIPAIIMSLIGTAALLCRHHRHSSQPAQASAEKQQPDAG